jgi:hypothetical protein
VTCSVSTDANGRFEIGRLTTGTYNVFATKDWYYAYQQPTQKVTITPSDPDINVTVRLGPRSGILAGSVKDKGTGTPIGNRSLLFLCRQ